MTKLRPKAIKTGDDDMERSDDIDSPISIVGRPNALATTELSTCDGASTSKTSSSPRS